MSVFVLEPPYHLLTSAGPFRPAVGNVLFADLADGIPALARALAAHLDAPWCPLALNLPDRRISGAVLAGFEPVPGTWAPLYASDYSHLPLPARVVAAVRRRPVPRPATLALWLARRLRRPSLGSALAECLGECPEPQHPPRTLTRWLRGIGPFEARDWRGLGGLARVVAGAREGLSLDAQAYLAGVDPRTLRRWLRLATDRPWSEVGGRVGWEWVLEAALRRAECVERRVVRRVSGEIGAPAGRWSEEPGRLRTGAG